jgi:hypothetical protein
MTPVGHIAAMCDLCLQVPSLFYTRLLPRGDSSWFLLFDAVPGWHHKEKRHLQKTSLSGSNHSAIFL